MRSAAESPAGGNCPVATVVISGDGEGDQTVESPQVKVSVREASNSAGRSKGEPGAAKLAAILTGGRSVANDRPNRRDFSAVVSPQLELRGQRS